jgi:hypothetical protein
MNSVLFSSFRYLDRSFEEKVLMLLVDDAVGLVSFLSKCGLRRIYIHQVGLLL